MKNSPTSPKILAYEGTNSSVDTHTNSDDNEDDDVTEQTLEVDYYHSGGEDQNKAILKRLRTNDLNKANKKKLNKLFDGNKFLL